MSWTCAVFLGAEKQENNPIRKKKNKMEDILFAFIIITSV